MDPKAEFILTTRRSHSPIFTFSKTMRPLEANVIEAIAGDEISFCRKESLDWTWLANLALQKGNLGYFDRSQALSRRLKDKISDPGPPDPPGSMARALSPGSNKR